MSQIIPIWRNPLRWLLAFYDEHRGPFGRFFVRLFAFFIVLNLACYWCAMFTIFPELTTGKAGLTNYKIQFPVGILGAMFASLPTCVHIGMFVRSAALAWAGRFRVDAEPSE